jgi:Uma2 family endonuclease
MSTPSFVFRYHTELIDGREIEKPLPTKLHAIVQKFLMFWLQQILPASYDYLPELRVICAAEGIVPDLAVFRRNAKFLEGHLAEPPELAVEIGSPGQPFSKLLEKCEKLAAAGAPLCWIVLPEKRQAFSFADFSLTEEKDVLRLSIASTRTVGLPLAELWAELDKDETELE